MIDIYRFINSKDVADYLRATGHQFTAGQAAYLVHKSADATLAERIDAWRAIVADMPEERVFVEYREYTYGSRELIEEHIADKEAKLQKFLNSDGAAYFPYESRWSEKPSWVPEKWCAENGLWNTLRMPVPFSTFDGCKDYLRREGRILGNGWRLDTLEEMPGRLEQRAPKSGVHYDRHVVCRVVMDEGWYQSYGHINDPEPQYTPLDYVVLDGNLEILDVAWGWNDMTFDYMVSAIPIPFQRGDIVIDRTSRVPHPFVFGFAIPWARDRDGSVRVDNEKLEELFHEQFNDLHREIEASNIEAFYDWRMTAYGYEIDVETGMVEVRPFGASDNYLNLEYYDGPLDGELRQLAIISELIKSEIDLGLAANSNRAASIDNHLKAMLQ